MKIELAYSKEKIEIEIPEKNIIEIVGSTPPRKKPEEKEIISHALTNPVASPSLGDAVRGKKSATILVSDVTRPCPSYKFLPFILEELEKAKIKDIRIIFGLGSHRKHTEEEKRKLVGEGILKKVQKLIDHDPEKCELIGYTKQGTPLEIYPEAKASDFLITTGNIEYHYFAGYSGGAKAAIPGICSRRTIQKNHSLMLQENATAGRFEDNPVRKDIEEAGKILGIDFIFNVILNDNKNIISAVAGKNNEAFVVGIKKYDEIFALRVKEKADLVITSAGGYPKDINLYQAQKALDNVKQIVKEGGEILLLASCEEGFGEKTFESWMAYAHDFEWISSKISKEFTLGGHKAYAISKLLTRTKISLYSKLSAKMVKKIGFKKISNLQNYLDEKISSNPRIKITIVPSGRFVRFEG